VVSIFFALLRKVQKVQFKSPKQLYPVVIEFKNGMTQTVKIKATSREKAEQRALKFNRAAKGIKRGVL
jgi:hypothetical protein